MTSDLMRFSVSTVLFGLGMGFVLSSASAQEAGVGADDKQEVGVDGVAEIVVTGSRIARPELDTVQPMQVLGGEQIDGRGYTNIGEALNEIAAFGAPGSSQVGGQSAFGPAQTFVDFFSLGTQRTLVLVNGRRFVSSNTPSIFGPVAAGSQVDLNNIPSTLVDRIETVAVGGAPIYGSDAIAGTVNILLKRDYEGVELKGQYGLSQRGDAPDRRMAMVAGKNFADGRGNITIATEYNEVDGVVGTDRAIIRAGNFFGSPPLDADAPFQKILYPDGRFTAFTIGGVPFSTDTHLVEDAGIRDLAGNILQFGPDGHLVPLDLGKVLRQGYRSSGGNGYSGVAFNNLLTSSKRILAVAQAHYDFSSEVRFFTEGWYTRAKGVSLVDSPNFNTALFDEAGTADGNLLVSIDNPFLSDVDRALIQENLEPEQREFYIGRALADLTTGRAEGIVETYRFVGGFEGAFDLGERTYRWEVSANYGRSRADGENRELIQQNFLNALDAVEDENGNIICRPGSVSALIPALARDCAPLDIFGQGRASQAAKDYIFAIARPVARNSQFIFNANVNGPIVDVGGGPMQFSLGYEHRREKTSFDPGDYYFGQDNGDGTRAQYGRSIPIDPVVGRFHTNELFGEVKIPFVSAETGLGWLHAVEFDGAIRYVKHSLVRGGLTWTAGGRIAFVPDLVFRGNYTRSIRSPAITEVFNPTSRAFESGKDPCDTRNVNDGPDPDMRKANCMAAGIDVTAFTSNYSDFTIPVTVSGNRSLDSEKANSWSVGAILRPHFLPRLAVAVDWVDIKLRNAIISLGGDAILNACYDSADHPNNQFCGLFDRGDDGQLETIRGGYYNAASQHFAGLTMKVTYDMALGALGKLGLSANYLYLDRLEGRVGDGDLNHRQGEIGNPRHSGTANLTYQKDGFSALIQAQYIGRGRFDVDEADNARDIKGVGDWWLFNATIGAKVSDHFDLKFIVDNVFDKRPPFPAPAGGGLRAYWSGILGRYFRISATAKF